jgi:hypothetical protein
MHFPPFFLYYFFLPFFSCLSVCLSVIPSSCLSVPLHHSTFSPLNIPSPTPSLSGGYRRMDSSGTVHTDESPPQLPRVRGGIQGERGGQESGEISLYLTGLRSVISVSVACSVGDRVLCVIFVWC